MQNISEAIGDIPVGIGARDLKQTIFVTLLPSWCSWSHDTPLHIDDVKLRFKRDWLEIAPRLGQPIDQDAIRSHFFKVKKVAGGAAKPATFAAGSGIDLYLELSDKKFEEAQDARASTGLALQCRTDADQPGGIDHIPGPASSSSSQTTQLVPITNSPRGQKRERELSIVSLTRSTLIRT